MPKYDVAVIGAGFGGLAAAALLSARGKKVAVVDRYESLDEALGGLEKDGFVFSVASSEAFGLIPAGEIHEVATKLGMLRNTSVHSPCYQVVLPDRRITVFPDWTATLEEFRREFPREIDLLVKFYRDLHDESVRAGSNRYFSYLVKYRSAKGFFRKYRFSRELMAFFDISSLFFFQKRAANLSLLSLLTLCTTSPLHRSGGIRQAVQDLRGTLLQQGIEFRLEEGNSGFVWENGRAHEIRTTAGVVEAETVLLDGMHLSPSTMLFIALRDEGVPVGMCRDVLVLPDYEFPEDFFTLSLSGRDDTTTAPAGNRTLMVSFRSQRGLFAGRQSVLAFVERVIPFIKDHLLFTERLPRDDKRNFAGKEIVFKTVRDAEGLLRSRRDAVYLLHEVHKMPFHVLSDVHRFIDLQK